MQVFKFDGAVGCDAARARAIIRTKLPRGTFIKFLEQDYIPGKGSNVKLVAEPNQVVLYMDRRWNAVALAPTFFGELPRKRENERTDLDEEFNWSDEEAAHPSPASTH